MRKIHDDPMHAKKQAAEERSRENHTAGISHTQIRRNKHRQNLERAETETGVLSSFTMRKRRQQEMQNGKMPKLRNSSERPFWTKPLR